MSKSKPKEGERVFNIRLTIRENEPSTVAVEEAGEADKVNKQIPDGMFGVREGLRIAGNAVREFYQTKQRKLLLEERAAEVQRRRQERKRTPAAKPPSPAPDPRQEVIQTPTGEVRLTPINLDDVKHIEAEALASRLAEPDPDPPPTGNLGHPEGDPINIPVHQPPPAVAEEPESLATILSRAITSARGGANA